MNIHPKIDGRSIAERIGKDGTIPRGLFEQPASAQQPPHNLEAEQALVGAALLWNEALDRVGDVIGPEHFFETLHGDLWGLIQSTAAAGRLASPTTLKTAVEAWPPISPTLTVPQYLGTLAGAACTLINARDYALTIRNLAERRSGIIACMGTIEELYDAASHVGTGPIFEGLQGSIDQIRRVGANERDIVTLDDAMGRAIDRASRAHQSGGGLSGISTGLRSLDAKVGGLSSGNLIILGGRPGMGKTSLATNIAQNVVTASDRRPVGFFSLEMDEEELGTRIISNMSGVPSWRMHKGELSQGEFSKLGDARRTYSSAPLFIDGSGALTVEQLMSRARRMKRKHGIELIVIDYLQLINGSTYRGNNRTAEVGEISKALKGLAKELCVPVLVLSQLNRGVESREDKRPQLSDLRESGSIEQDADIVMFVYREEYYVEQREPDAGDLAKHDKWEGELAACAGKAEVIIGKHRHGPVGTVTLGFKADLTSFSDLGGGR